MRKRRIIEYDVFEKSETSIGLVWPAGQVFDFQPGLQALWVRPGQAGKKWPVGSSALVRPIGNMAGECGVSLKAVAI